jgi:hypothetical protein
VVPPVALGCTTFAEMSDNTIVPSFSDSAINSLPPSTTVLQQSASVTGSSSGLPKLSLLHTSGQPPPALVVPTAPAPAAPGNTPQAPQEDVESVYPPTAFGIVEAGVFRCNAFEPTNFSFIENLELKSVIYLSPEIPHKSLKEFLSLNSIEFVSDHCVWIGSLD